MGEVSILSTSKHSESIEEQEPPIFNYINRKNVEKQHKLCVHNVPDCKFGKCFICERDANNYDKNHFVPLCGMECKNKLKRLNS